MKTQLVKIEQLEEVVKQSGLDIQEGEQIKQSYLPFLNQLAEIQEQSSKIDYQNPKEIDEKIARELRLKTVKVRTGAGDLKESRKRIHLLKGNLEQAAFNLISASCKLAEETFTSVEKAREIAEAKRKSELKAQREIEVQPFQEYIPFGLNLGELDSDSYVKLLTGAKLQLQSKIDAEIKAEQERIAKQKAIDEENERIRVENARLQKEAEEKEKALEVERKKQAKILADAKEIADAKLKSEQEENAKLQAEIKAKADAEVKAKKEAELKAAAELKAKQLAEKKAKAAPDKKKLNNFAIAIDNIILPELNSPEADQILSDAKGLLNKVSKYIREKTQTL